MDPKTGLTVPPTPSDTRIGIVIRLAFFVATVIIGLRLFPILLYVVFGVLVGASVGLCATALLANIFTMRIFDRLALVDIGLRLEKASGINFLLGLVFGGGAAALMLIAPLLAGTAHLVPKQNSAFSWPSLAFYLAILWVAAAGEEMIFRGYAFQLLIQKIGPFATILPTAVIFGFAHASNPAASALGIGNTILWGVLLGFAFLRSHDLWLPIGLHYGWNAALPLFGVNLSGLTIDVTRYYYRWDLLPVWSGGAYGPEGGLLATVFIIGLFFALLKAPIQPQYAAIARVLNDT